MSWFDSNRLQLFFCFYPCINFFSLLQDTAIFLHAICAAEKLSREMLESPLGSESASL